MFRKLRLADSYGPTGLGFIVGLILGILLLVTIITIPCLLVENRNCNYAGQQYKRDTKWDLWAGCYIQSNDRYISLDKYLAISQDK